MASMGKAGRVFALLVLIALILASCVTIEPFTDDSEPVGIGLGTDDYKRSPCACITLEHNAPDPEYLRRLQRRLTGRV